MKQNLNLTLLGIWRRQGPKAGRRQSSLFPARRVPVVALLAAVLIVAAGVGGCQAERRKSDAELGLTQSQAVGRHIYDRQCSGCHHAYSSSPLKGPSLQGLFRSPYMKNGMPANDERVEDILMHGRAKMPAFGRALTPEQIDRVLEYLHTL